MGILQSYHISVNDLKGCDLAVFNLTIVGSIFCLQYSLIELGIVFPGKRAMLNQSSVSFIFLMGICLEAGMFVPTYDTISKKGYGGVAQKNFWATPFELFQMRGNALFGQFDNFFGQISKTMF